VCNILVSLLTRENLAGVGQTLRLARLVNFWGVNYVNGSLRENLGPRKRSTICQRQYDGIVKFPHCYMELKVYSPWQVIMHTDS